MAERPPINRQRIYAGWLCIALAFALVVSLGVGWLDPIGAGAAGINSLVTLLAALLPVLAGPVILFALGLRLLKAPRQ
ncbi:MAG TPA: hypothetical protein VFS99_05875 [Xanthomonadaceae bacterium]|nr:hypothetical protein [Xanthomonadaceae bacterium]